MCLVEKCILVSHKHIRGAFHDNFPGFSGFGFCRKLTCMKTQPETEKARKNNGCVEYFTGFGIMRE